jgi:hypothetical protein
MLNVGQGMVGSDPNSGYVYDAIWTMGPSYLMAVDGSTLGSLYGLAWSHANKTGQGIGWQFIVGMGGVAKHYFGETGALNLSGYYYVNGPVYGDGWNPCYNGARPPDWTNITSRPAYAGWTAYTPTTDLTAYSNLSGVYCQSGGLVYVSIVFMATSTAAIAAANYMSLPVMPGREGNCWTVDKSQTAYKATGSIAAGTAKMFFGAAITRVTNDWYVMNGLYGA